MGNLQIEFPKNGDVLNRHDGHETDDGLVITVRGRCPTNAEVRVNDEPAGIRGDSFEALVTLKERRNELHITAGDDTESLVVLYDRHSFPRYRFSVDDVVCCFTEVARFPERYPSLFDHWFFAFFKKLHDDFSARVQMNIYLENPESDFDLTQFPDRYKEEWQEHATWLRLSFHARGNDCYDKRIYAEASYETLKKDCEIVEEQILRFAGRETLCSAYTTLHMAHTNHEGGRALHDKGFRGLTGRFGCNAHGNLFRTAYYVDDAVNLHVGPRNLWYDPEMDLYFVNCPRFLNNIPLGMITFHYERLVNGSEKNAPYDVIDFLVHEEHFWKGFLNGRGYKPDNMERCITAAMWATERGLQPVCFEKGIAGNEG